MKGEVENQISESTGTTIALWPQEANTKGVFCWSGRVKHFVLLYTNKAETIEDGAILRTTVNMLLPEKRKKKREREKDDMRQECDSCALQ